ncbi:MAG: class I SAM-dependent methyltransferase [Lentisphaeria bacterium]|nr:class I SAM-dependent methyltransferase [Lentisphaeria bacterium]
MISDDYELIDSGHGAKLERFGPVTLDRACGQAIWPPRAPRSVWRQATAAFDRKDGNRWLRRDQLPDAWQVTIEGIHFRLSGTDFGHLGVFPEQRRNWRWVTDMLMAEQAAPGAIRVLNVFAYSGGMTLAAARTGAAVCHVDASRGMVEWARENAALNTLAEAPVRWIVDDVHKFMERENRRERHYDAIILDPPSFGRGTKGEIYKLETDLPATLAKCRALLSSSPLFVLLSCHTPQVTPQSLANMLAASMPEHASRTIDFGEMLLEGAAGVPPVPNGAWACWRRGDLPGRVS